VFYVRAHLLARREDDVFSLSAPTRPRDLSRLLKLADRRRHVVELGTGTGWTAIALVLADRSREVISYDPVVHPLRESYVSLVGSEARARLAFRADLAQAGPREHDPGVDLLFIDIGGHGRSDTADSFLAWRDACKADAVVAFHDFGPQFPGVPLAIAQLKLTGSVIGESLFVWNVADGLAAEVPAEHGS
jgi:predicted O-methyltransferase YrrM